MDESLAKELRLLYRSIGRATVADLTKVPITQYRSNRGYGMFQDFSGGRSPEDLEIDIHSVIHSLSSLFDHLRAWARSGARGVDNVVVAVRASRDLQIIMDLWTLKKHGNHNRNGGWSKLRPTLTNIAARMKITARAGQGVASYFITPDGKQHATPGSFVVTTADVIDGKGQKIGDFHEIATSAIEAWKQLISQLS